VSQFSVFSAPALDIFEFLSSATNALTCIIPAPQRGDYHVVAPTEYVTSLLSTAQQIAWPVSLHSLVVTGEVITRDILELLVDSLGNSLLAMLPLVQVTNYQSVELKLNKLIDLTSLNHLNEQFNVDINIVSTLPSLLQPGLVVLDMDSTSIEIECIDEIAKLAGVGEEVSAITELAMQGRLDFSESLRARVSKLKGVELSLLDQIANDLPLMPGMRDLVAQFKAHQWKVAIASGGFTYFADNLKDLLGLDAAVSNTLAHDGKVLTGEVSGEIVDAKVKATTVLALAKQYNIPLSQTIAIGDGANDLVMMEQAALGIAFHAKPLVQEQANVAINQGNLGAVIALLAR